MHLDVASKLLLGESRAMNELRSRIRKAAPTLLPVLITGPTGSGKELVAQALHELSAVRGRCVALNVCAVPDAMFEATLFGHVRGAFTGATHDLPGHLSEADRGTLFLDEIGSLPVAQQSKLLRALETQSYRPVGASNDRRSTFRLVSATSESISLLLERSALRRDLLYRLRAIHLVVPPLSSRRDDIPSLAHHFAARARDAFGKLVQFSDSAVRALQAHEWAGNVRELRMIVESCVAMADDGILGREAVIRELSAGLMLDAEGSRANGVEATPKSRLLSLLHEHDFDTLAVAIALGVDRTTVYRRMGEFGIPTPKRSRRSEGRVGAAGAGSVGG